MATTVPHRHEDSLRDVARDAVRAEVVERAWELFAEYGFAATTVDQIADAAGMSRSTFFRYFASGKHELITARLFASGDELAAALQARPADEPAWRALHAALRVLVGLVESHEQVARRLHVMLQEEPDVRAAMAERGRRWLELLEPLVAARLTTTKPRQRQLRARALTGSALACFDAAQLTWANAPDADLAALLDEAMAAVADVRSP